MVKTLLLLLTGVVVGAAGGFFLAARLAQPGYAQLHSILQTQTSVELARHLNSLALLDAQQVAQARESMLPPVSVIVSNLTSQPPEELAPESLRQLRIAKAYFTVHPTEDKVVHEALEKVPGLPDAAEVRDCKPELQQIVEKARAMTKP